MPEILENPRASCLMGGALGTLLAIPRVVPILHTGPGCSQMTHLGQIHQGGLKAESYMVTPPCTVMLEKEIVFGGLDRLRETIRGAIEVFDGDLYCVLTGCTAGIIGDDVGSVIAEFQDVPLVFADTAGFKGDTYAGYETALRVLSDALTRPRAGAPDRRTVNLFGIVPYQDLYWQGNLNEIRRILARLGVKTNTFFGVEESVGAFRQAARAACNLIFSPWLAREVEQVFRDRHGVESLRFDCCPMGPTETTRFVRAVGGALGLDPARVEAVIAEEEAYVYSFFSTLAGYMEQHRVALVGDAGTVTATLRFLVNDFGQIPVLAVVTDQIEDADARAAVEAALGALEFPRPPAVFLENDQWRIKEILRAYRDEITQIYGSALERETALELRCKYVNHTFPCSEKLIFDKGYAGYRGCLKLLEDIHTRNHLI
ncbi:MAG: nitrogen fixation protein NifK [Oscillospiraceae bacterium]|jgi:nitrogenase molybdenum-iron protein beta chain|nr:nitrogen fixation protein NifK [Oscillospiraceae bacterium]